MFFITGFSCEDGKLTAAKRRAGEERTRAERFTTEV